MALSLTASAFVCASFGAQAATFDDINKSSVFLKQNNSNTCTLCSVTMMLRRAAILSGKKDWSDITESAVKSAAWLSGQGLAWNFKYAGFTVGHDCFDSSKSQKSQLAALLEKHPEGVVIYDRNTPHAVLVTDYTDGIFYCAEPADHYPSGRIPISKAYGVTVSNADDYWYIVSPSLKIENGDILDEAAEDKALAPVGSVYVLGRYVTTAESGLRLRKAAVDGKQLSLIPYGTQVDVFEIEDGWGKTKYDGIKGWICLDYADCLEDSQVKKVSLSQTKYVFDGETHKPAVTVVDEKGNKLKKDEDYTVKYATGRKKIGVYAVKVTFMGDYIGSVMLRFRITPDEVEDLELGAKTGAVKVTFDEVDYATGYEIYKSAKKDGKYEKVATTKDTSYVVGKLKSEQKYFVKVRAYTLVEKTKIYGPFSSVKSITTK